MCYGEPELKPEDKAWDNEGVSDGYDSEIEQLKQVNQENTVKPEVSPLSFCRLMCFAWNHDVIEGAPRSIFRWQRLMQNVVKTCCRRGLACPQRSTCLQWGLPRELQVMQAKNGKQWTSQTQPQP